MFGHDADVIGAAGWQINSHALALEETLGFSYASDVRGESAFYPQMDGVTSGCLQIPTTLPTLDELIGLDDITDTNVHEVVFAASRKILPNGHVYTLQEELEGMALLPVMQQLLADWQAADDTLGSLRDTWTALDQAALPTRQVVWDEVPGRSGVLAVQAATCS